MKTEFSKIFFFGLAIGSIAAYADAPTTLVSRYTEGEAGSSDVYKLEPVDSMIISFSMRAGVHDWKDSEFVDKSWGAQGEMRLVCGDTPLDIVLRGYYAKVEYEDTYSFGTRSYRYRAAQVRESEIVQYFDDEQTCFGGSLQLQFNLARHELVNPYIAAGAMYEKYEHSYSYIATRNTQMRYKWVYGSWGSSYYGDYENDDHGWAFVGRMGLEIDPSPFYLRLEASWVSEIYYNDDPQAELNAIAGVEATKNIRFDVAGTYFTEWKEYYITAGLTLSF